MILHACIGCGRVVFPARLRCHRCGGVAWREEPCDGGVIEATTAIQPADPIHLAAVRTPQDVQLIVRLAGALTPGTAVALHEAGDGAIWGNERC